jgi:choline dehydrogenase-like flavoprotein
MLLDVLSWQHGRDLTVYWGARTQEDLHLLDEVEAIAREHYRMRFVPLSWAGRNWTGRTVDDDLAALDSGCRVIGVRGLVVADASIFPTLMRAGTNIPTIMAAEKVLAMRRQEQRHRAAA